MKKLLIIGACLLSILSMYAQKNRFYLSEKPNYKEYKPEFAGEFITSKLLKRGGVKNVEELNVKRYRLVLAPKYLVKTESEMLKVFKDIRKCQEIQKIVDNINEQSQDPLKSLNLLKEEYPKAFFFRTPERPYICGSYEEWSKEMLRLDGVFMKAQSEELCRERALILAYYGNRFALENPSKMVVLHYNGRGRDIYFDGEEYFAGHWIYAPGTVPTEDFDEKSEWINVENSDCFQMGYGLQQANKNDDVVIVPIDANGNKCWEEAEQTTIIAKRKGMIKLARGRYGTKARPFKKGRTYIAPHISEGPWGGNNNNLLWYYNYSTACPRDKYGRTASDVLSEELAKKFSEDGYLHSFHGIEFDIAPFDVTRPVQKRMLDVNNDGLGDGGIIDGINVYGAGVHQFYLKLREKLGSKRLIMADGVVSDCQRATFVLNGAEAEGLSYPHKDYYFNELSRSINVLSYWTRHFQEPGFSYITQKEQGAPQNYDKYGRMRVVTAMAICLGIGINSFATYPKTSEYEISIPDEFLGGTLQQRAWLGKPLGKMQHLYLEGNLLEGKSIPLIKGNSLPNEDEVYYLRGVENPGVNGNDFTIQLEAKALKTMKGQHVNTPRHIYIEVLGGDKSKDSQWLTRKQMGVVGVADFNSSIFFFRDLGKGIYDFKITIEGEGEVDIKNITAHNQPFVFYRNFENGCVIGNLSAKTIDFDLQRYFPGISFCRITGTKGQDTSYNTGSREASIVRIPKINALFLRKQ